jgi:hypothetical protein
MALVERQVTEKIVSRGLGGSDTEAGKVYSVNLSVSVTVWEDRLYYPTTGTFSREEDISGWYWDRTHSQAYSAIPTHEIKTSVGGALYLESEGIPADYHNGYLIGGCELLDIEKVEATWLPVLKTGSYSVNGKDKILYSSNSICKRAEEVRTTIPSNLNKDNISVAIYSRGNDFVKSVYREYKEDNAIYSYSWDGNDLMISENGSLAIGNPNTVSKNALEYAGIATSSNQNLYTKYFPLKSIDVFAGDNLSKLTKDEDFTIDKDFGVIQLENSGTLGNVYCRYVAVPRIDIEVEGSRGFKGTCDLKPHSSKQANGVIEISSEDRHVSKIDLALANKEHPLEYSSGFKGVKATCLDSKGNPVDEVEVVLYNLSTFKEIKYEGNLEEQRLVTNSDGEVGTVISAPLNNNSSSFFFEKYNNGFDLNQDEVNIVNRNVQETALVFEILKVDPFHGSNGITLSLVWDASENAYSIADDANFTNADYKIFRNLINNELVKGKSSEAACYELFYNSGFVSYNQGNTTKLLPILKISDSHIWLADSNQQSIEVKIFKKNENDKGLGFEHLLYEENQGSYHPITATINNSLLKFDALDGRHNSILDIVSGYRVVVPRKEQLQASCVDPATGITIVSNIVDVALNLPNVYKTKIILDNLNNEGEQVRIGVKSYLSVDAVGNTLVIGGEDE